MTEFRAERFTRDREAPVSRASMAAEAVAGLRASTAVSSMPVFVDVGSRKIDSQVERDGVPITPLQINADILKDFVLQRPPLLVKVVSQSVAPGTPVPVGTTVDLVMAPPFKLPVGVVTGCTSGSGSSPSATRTGGSTCRTRGSAGSSHGPASNQLDANDRAEVKEIFAAAAIEGSEITDEPATTSTPRSRRSRSSRPSAAEERPMAVQVQSLSEEATRSFVGPGQPVYVVGTLAESVITVFRPPAEAGLEVAADVEVDAATRLERADFFVAASPSGPTLIGSVAEVRDGDSGTCVVDFGRMVTVPASRCGSGHRARSPTCGGGTASTGSTSTSATPAPSPRSPPSGCCSPSTTSTEVRTPWPRTGSSSFPPSPPSSKLVVDGTVVWFERQGSTAGLVTRKDGHDRVARSGWTGGAVEHGVDRTDALRDALAKARVEGGKRRVQVRLRATTPGTLTLASDLQLLHEHPVDFGAGQRRTSLDLDEEGVRTVTLPGPPFVPADSIREVAATLTGAFGPQRVAPVTGPAPLTDADLVVTVGRAVLLGLPVPLAQPFGEVQGVRLRVQPLAGRTAKSRAGSSRPIRPPASRPSPCPARRRTAGGRRRTRRLAHADLRGARGRPRPRDRDGRLLAGAVRVVRRGRLRADRRRGPRRARAAPAARRRLQGVVGAALAVRRERGPPRRAPRGRAARSQGPVPAVTLAVDHVATPGSTAAAVATADATRDALRVVLGLGSGVPPADGAVPLSLSVAAPGSVTLEDVVVAYRKAGA